MYFHNGECVPQSIKFYDKIEIIPRVSFEGRSREDGFSYGRLLVSWSLLLSLLLLAATVLLHSRRATVNAELLSSRVNPSGAETKSQRPDPGRVH